MGAAVGVLVARRSNWLGPGVILVTIEGDTVGAGEGADVGCLEGWNDGCLDGCIVGLLEG